MHLEDGIAPLPGSRRAAGERHGGSPWAAPDADADWWRGDAAPGLRPASATGPSATEAPATGPSATEPSATEPSATEAPPTAPAATGLSATEASATGLSATEASATGFSASGSSTTGSSTVAPPSPEPPDAARAPVAAEGAGPRAAAGRPADPAAADVAAPAAPAEATGQAAAGQSTAAAPAVHEEAPRGARTRTAAPPLAPDPATRGPGDPAGKDTEPAGKDTDPPGSHGDEPTADAARAAGERDATQALAGRSRPDPAPVAREQVPEVMVLPDRPPVAGRGDGAGGGQPSVPGQMGSPPRESFWLTAIEAGETWPQEESGPIRAATIAEAEAAARTRRRNRPPTPRRPAVGLVALVVLGFVATFFSWVSAEPLWLAVGHGETGTVTVTRCAGAGVGQRCVGTFTGGGWNAPRVTALGVPAAQRQTGAVLPARMVNPESRQAFVGASGWPLHLRWAIGIALVLLCGLGIASATGARRLDTARARTWAVLSSLVAPLLMLGGFLVAAF